VFLGLIALCIYCICKRAAMGGTPVPMGYPGAPMPMGGYPAPMPMAYPGNPYNKPMYGYGGQPMMAGYPPPMMAPAPYYGGGGGMGTGMAVGAGVLGGLALGNLMDGPSHHHNHCSYQPPPPLSLFAFCQPLSSHFHTLATLHTRNANWIDGGGGGGGGDGGGGGFAAGGVSD